MAEEIINRVVNSKLKTFDLEEIYPEGKRVLFDLKDWLFEELILKEKDFRASVKNHDWSQYKNAFVAVSCSVDAIIPSWAFMLVVSELTPFAKKVVIGNLELLETPMLSDRQQWIERLSMCHWNFQELSNGSAWQHMRKFV